MRHFCAFLLWLLAFNSWSQDPNYEQSAFKFFYNQILADEDIKQKINLSTKLENIEFPNWWPQCLEGYDSPSHDPNSYIISQRDSLELGDWDDEERFRVNDHGRNKYPVMFVSKAFSSRLDRFVVNAVIIYRWHGSIFRIEMDTTGRVVNWCEGGWID